MSDVAVVVLLCCCGGVVGTIHCAVGGVVLLRSVSRSLGARSISYHYLGQHGACCSAGAGADTGKHAH